MLVQLLKKNAHRIPFWLGYPLSQVPYSYRPLLASSYKQSRLEIQNYASYDSVDRKKEYIFEKVKRLVYFAIKNVPFYTKYYSLHHFDPDSLKSFDDLERIPIVSKEILSKVELEERSCYKKGRYLSFTGGSTGEPFKFYSDPKQLGHEWAHFHKIWGNYGYKQSDLLLSISLEPNQNPIFYDAMRNALVLNIHYPFHVIAENLSKKKSVLRQIKYIRGYPSSIAEFLLFCHQEDPSLLQVIKTSLKACFLASEYPHPQFREPIERIAECPTISWYGHSERTVLAYERNSPYVYEPLQSYGFCEAVICTGDFTTLVGTSYENYASPLIRYSLDEGVQILESVNGLLKSFQIKEGRSGDVILDANNTPISITHLNLSCRQETWKIALCIQVEQRKPGQLIIWVTPRNKGTSIKEIRESFDFEKINFDCEFRKIQEPFRTSRGKVMLRVSTSQCYRNSN